MPKLSAEDIAAALGMEAPPPPPEPSTRHEAALADINKLDGRMHKLIEANRRDGETHEKAASRLYGENPGLIQAHKTEKALILQRHGIEGAAIGGC
jgi:hypothetical protein